jgi:hypothetical protein
MAYLPVSSYLTEPTCAGGPTGHETRGFPTAIATTTRGSPDGGFDQWILSPPDGTSGCSDVGARRHPAGGAETSGPRDWRPGVDSDQGESAVRPLSPGSRCSRPAEPLPTDSHILHRPGPATAGFGLVLSVTGGVQLDRSNCAPVAPTLTLARPTSHTPHLSRWPLDGVRFRTSPPRRGYARPFPT